MVEKMKTDVDKKKHLLIYDNFKIARDSNFKGSSNV